jgi:Mg2+ and Co2+ transporter CorA
MSTSLLPDTWDLPQALRDRLGAQVGRQRAMEADGHLLLVLHRAPGPGELRRRGSYFWRDPEGTWRSSGFDDGPGALEEHLSSYAVLLDRHDQQEQVAHTAMDHFRLLEALAPLHRAIRNLYAALQDARHMVRADRTLLDARDRAYELERTVELLTVDVKNGLDYAMTRRMEQQAASSHDMAVASHRLNLLAAFFFPLATLSAVFGMDLPHGIEQLWPPWPFVIVLLAGLGLGFALKRIIGAPARPQEPASGPAVARAGTSDPSRRAG